MIGGLRFANPPYGLNELRKTIAADNRGSSAGAVIDPLPASRRN